MFLLHGWWTGGIAVPCGQVKKTLPHRMSDGECLSNNSRESSVS